MTMRHLVGTCAVALLLSDRSRLGAAGSDVADAVMRGDTAAVRALLAQKADVNAPQADGATALHWAVYRADAALTDLLLQAGANPKVANREGFTPLSLAGLNGDAGHHREPAEGRRGSERGAAAGGDAAHDGVAHRQRGGDEGAARPRSAGQREGDAAWHHGVDVGGGSGACCCGPAPARPRGRHECPLESCPRSQEGSPRQVGRSEAVEQDTAGRGTGWPAGR